jgi:hypothetical protein
LIDLQGVYDRLPRLEESPHVVTSAPDDTYNCVGWVFRELDAYYAPDLKWPADVPPPDDPDQDLDAYVALFASRGYSVCGTPDVEYGFLKIALYAKDHAFHHVAKQLPNGEWSSKLGEAHDLRHEHLEALEGDTVYFKGAVASVFMKRPYDPNDPNEWFNLE